MKSMNELFKKYCEFPQSNNSLWTTTVTDIFPVEKIKYIRPTNEQTAMAKAVWENNQRFVGEDEKEDFNKCSDVVYQEYMEEGKYILDELTKLGYKIIPAE